MQLVLVCTLHLRRYPGVGTRKDMMRFESIYGIRQQVSAKMQQQIELLSPVGALRYEVAAAASP